jgi:hypothetical protein
MHELFIWMAAFACGENISWAWRMRKWWMLAFYVVLSAMALVEYLNGYGPIRSWLLRL